MSHLTFKIIYLVILVIILIVVLSNRGNAETYKEDKCIPDPTPYVKPIKKTITVGRMLDNDIVVQDPSVNKRCIRITQYEDGTFRLTDLQSANGCRVNGKRVEGEVPLYLGDIVIIGHNVIVRWEDAFGIQMKDQDNPFNKWEKWKADHPNVETIFDPEGWGSSTHHPYMMATIKRDYPEWRVIHINDNKFLASLGFIGEDEYAVYESSLGIINKKGEEKDIIFHTFGKVLIIY